MSGRVFYGVAQSQCKNRTRETQESVTSTDTVEEGSEQLLGRLLVSVPAPRRKGGRERSARKGVGLTSRVLCASLKQDRLSRGAQVSSEVADKSILKSF